MKNEFKAFLVAVIFLLVSCSEDNVNNPLVYNFNGDFETSVNHFNEIDGWYPTNQIATADYVNFNWGKEEKHSGEYSVSISIDENHPTDTPICYNWTKIYKPFEIGTEYEITGWVKSQNLSSSAFMVVQCWKNRNEMVGFFTSQYTHQIIGTNDWTEFSTKFIPPDETYEVRIRIGITAPFDNGGKVWFDDIYVEKL